MFSAVASAAPAWSGANSAPSSTRRRFFYRAFSFLRVSRVFYRGVIGFGKDFRGSCFSILSKGSRVLEGFLKVLLLCLIRKGSPKDPLVTIILCGVLQVSWACLGIQGCCGLGEVVVAQVWVAMRLVVELLKACWVPSIKPM